MNFNEAAAIDGANEWQIFRRITLPLLRPVNIICRGNQPGWFISGV